MSKFDEYVEENASPVEGLEFTTVDMLQYDLSTILHTMRQIFETLDTSGKDLREVVGPHLIGARHLVEAACGNLEKLGKVRQ